MKIYTSTIDAIFLMFVSIGLFIIMIFIVLMTIFGVPKFDVVIMIMFIPCTFVLWFSYKFLSDGLRLFKERKLPFFEFRDNSFYYRDSGSSNYRILSLSDIDSVRFSGSRACFVYISLKNSSDIVIRTDELNIDNKILMKGFQDFAKLQPAFGWDWTDLKRHHKQP